MGKDWTSAHGLMKGIDGIIIVSVGSSSQLNTTLIEWVDIADHIDAVFIVELTAEKGTSLAKQMSRWHLR